MLKPHQPTYRTFLQDVAAAGAATMVHGSACRAIGAESPNDRPSFATIGLHNQGWTITAQAFQSANVVALADVDSSMMDKRLRHLTTGTSKWRSKPCARARMSTVKSLFR